MKFFINSKLTTKKCEYINDSINIEILFYWVGIKTFEYSKKANSI